MWYVYAYDIYGSVTYFTVSKVPDYARHSNRDLEYYFTKIAAKKLHVLEKNVRLGQYSRERFSQGHLPHKLYKEGKWVSATWEY